MYYSEHFHIISKVRYYSYLKERIVQKGEVGKLLRIYDCDAPEYISDYGMGLDIDWGDMVCTYNDDFLFNGFYYIEEYMKLHNLEDLRLHRVEDFFHTADIRKKIPSKPLTQLKLF